MSNKKYMSFWMMVALVTGNMVGSGIFLLPSGLAAFGSISLLSWVFTATGAILLALVFCNMSRLVPNQDGGPYIYVREGLGKFMGFQSGFGYWVAAWVGNAAIVLAMVGYLQFFFPVLANKTATGWTAILIIWALAFLNMFGARKMGWVQLISTIAKVLPLLLIILVGWWYIHPEHFSILNRTAHNDLDAFSGAAALTFWAFIGLESAAVMASKVKNPTKMVPLATITGTLIAAFIYIASSTIIMGMIPAHELMDSTAPFALAASKIIGSSGGVVIAVTAVIACLGTLNGWIMMTAVVSQSMAETKLFPNLFAKQNKHGAPIYGLILQAVLITALLLFTMSPSLVDQFNLLILIAVLASLIPYFYTAIANVVLGNAKKSITRKGVVISVFASLYALWAIMGSGEKVVYYGMAFLLFGAFIYLIVECKKE